MVSIRAAIARHRSQAVVGFWLPHSGVRRYDRSRATQYPNRTVMRQRLLQSIAMKISDYRQGEIAVPTEEHVDRWIRQFEPAVQEPMLAEMDHVLRQSYAHQGQD
jgi:hypothetical protein